MTSDAKIAEPEEIRAWLASPDYPENPPPGLIPTLSKMREDRLDRSLQILSDASRGPAATAVENLKHTASLANLLVAAGRGPVAESRTIVTVDLSGISFEEGEDLLRALARIPFSRACGTLRDVVIDRVWKPLCQRLYSIDAQRGHKAIHNAMLCRARRERPASSAGNR